MKKTNIVKLKFKKYYGIEDHNLLDNLNVEPQHILTVKSLIKEDFNKYCKKMKISPLNLLFFIIGIVLLLCSIITSNIIKVIIFVSLGIILVIPFPFMYFYHKIIFSKLLKKLIKEIFLKTEKSIIVKTDSFKILEKNPNVVTKELSFFIFKINKKIKNDSKNSKEKKVKLNNQIYWLKITLKDLIKKYNCFNKKTLNDSIDKNLKTKEKKNNHIKIQMSQ